MTKFSWSFFILSFFLFGCKSTSTQTVSTPATNSLEPHAKQKADADEAPPSGRLPADVTPTHYRLTLTILPEKKTFSGEVQIELKLEKPRQVIWLHGKNLHVKQATAHFAGKVIAGTYKQISEHGVARVTLQKPLGPGRVSLQMAYDAPFAKNLHGLFRIDHSARSYAFTQFEPTSARMCFPGFDEPGFKAPFDVALVVHRDHVAVANTPARATKIEGDLKRVTYATTKTFPPICSPLPWATSTWSMWMI